MEIDGCYSVNLFVQTSLIINALYVFFLFVIYEFIELSLHQFKFHNSIIRLDELWCTSSEVFYKVVASVLRTANKGWSVVNYCQSLVFDHPYLSCNDHCDWWLFQEIFLLLLFFLQRNSFEQSWTFFLGIVKHLKQFQKQPPEVFCKKKCY